MQGRIGRPTHKRGLSSRLLSGRSVVQVGGLALSMTIITAVLIFGGDAERPMSETPDVPSAAEGQPPTVKRVPSAKPSEPGATSSAKQARTKKSGASDESSTKPSVSRPSTPAEPATTRVWSAVGSYKQGELVTHQGSTFRAVKDYTGVGDPNWIHAESLWVRV